MELWDDLTAAIIGLFVGTIFGNEISRVLYRPKVVIKFKNVNSLLTKDGFFWSIFVANVGRTFAENCAGSITIFNLEKADILEQNEAMPDEKLPRYKQENLNIEYPRNQLTAPSRFREMKSSFLCWTHQGNPSELNINPGMVRSLDICRVQYHEQEKFWYLIFPSEKGWRKVKIRVKLKEYHGRLFVCPANEFPKSIDFKIYPNEEGIPEFKQIKRSRIKRIKYFFKRKNMILDDH